MRIAIAYALYRLAYLVVHDAMRIHEIGVSVRFALFLEKHLVPDACWADLATCLYNGRHEPAESWEDWKWTCQGRECYRDRKCNACWCRKFDPERTEESTEATANATDN